MGSAGRRYLRLVKELGTVHIDVLRSGRATIKEEVSPSPNNIFFDIEKAFDRQYDVAIVCTPSALHYEYIVKALDNGINVLTEKPVSHKMEHLFRIKSLLEQNDLKFGVCHNLRYHPAIKNLKKYIETGLLGEPICTSVQFCAYVPEWHPWEDYKKSYAAQKELGGGAALTHIHEIDYLNWLFGKPIKYNGIKASKKFIDINVDECAVINIEHNSGVVSQLLLSLNTKPPKRNLMVYFTKGRIEVNLITGKTSFESNNGENIDMEKGVNSFNFDKTYTDMLMDFDKFIETGDSNICTIDEAIESTRIVTEI